MSKVEINPFAHIVGTMQGWLEGEQVWPYAKIIRTWGPEFEMYRRRMSRQIAAASKRGSISFKEPNFEKMFSRGAAIHAVRDEWIARFGFAIPCAELLDGLAKAGHVVEVGAGTGYMTRLMRNRGIDVVGTDYDWRGPSSHGFMTGQHDAEQVNGIDAKTAVRRYPDSTVFCSWPTLHATWFHQMLKAMRIGQHLIVVGEDACADRAAWEYLNDCFEETGIIDIPTFEHMNDIASVHVKKRARRK